MDLIQQDLKKGNTSCVELVKYYLFNISNNLNLNAFLEVYDTEALESAAIVDGKIREGTQGKLAGLVVGLKDVICHEGHDLSCASKMLEGFESQFNATAVDRLLDEDAIIIGRQNCDEFAMGSSNENSAFGPTRNAANPKRVPGGSSGGSAVAVQTNMCQVSLGSDTGGSVRQPAAFCGVIGMKPTYSRISRHGLAAYASSFDTIGIISKSISDNRKVLEVIAGYDEFDSTVSKNPVNLVSEKNESKQRVGYFKESLDADGLDSEVKENFNSVLDSCRAMGHEVTEINFPLLEYMLPCYYILTTAEASANLSRYDGAHYGYRSSEVQDLTSMYVNSRSEGLGNEVKNRIMLGTFVLSAGYYEAYFTKAQQVRAMIQKATREVLELHNFILMPTTPSAAFEIAKPVQSPIETYLADLYTVHASLAGIPAISVPSGINSQGLPLGFQIMSDNFKESEIYGFADSLLNYIKA